MVNKFLLFHLLFFTCLCPTLLFAEHATTSAGQFANGVMKSKHNLATGKPFATGIRFDNGARQDGTSETCVFCHTPHFANQAEGPAWNRTATNGPYEAYGSTIAGTSIPGINGASLGCLSCHDGVTTFDTLINRPGKDLATGDQDWGFIMGGSQGPSGTGYTWADNFHTALQNPLGIDNMPGDNKGICTQCHDSNVGIPFLVLANGEPGIDSMIIAESAALAPGGTGSGMALTNDHPISVVYDEKVASLYPKSTLLSSISMDAKMEDGSTTQALVPGNLWAVKGFISDSASIQDLLRGDAGGKSGDYVQCTSCHDPHYKNMTNPEKDTFTTFGNIDTVTTHDDWNIDGLFLRRVGGNSDSGVCRTCHNKT